MSNVKLGELRANNWYESTKFKQPVRCEVDDIVQIYHNADGAMVDEDHIAMVFKPIPLTEEWLKKLGGEYVFPPMDAIWGVYKFGKFSVITPTAGYEFVLSPANNWKSVKIQYVHQLQNLYFALTGEELTLKD